MIDDQSLVSATLEAYNMRPPILTEADLLVRLANCLQAYGVNPLYSHIVARDAIPSLKASGLVTPQDRGGVEMLALGCDLTQKENEDAGPSGHARDGKGSAVAGQDRKAGPQNGRDDDV